MIKEIKQIESNASFVKEKDKPIQTPMYFFVSNGEEITINNWQSLLSGYIGDLIKSRYMELDCGHYVHSFEPEIIADESKQFIRDILSQ